MGVGVEVGVEVGVDVGVPVGAPTTGSVGTDGGVGDGVGVGELRRGVGDAGSGGKVAVAGGFVTGLMVVGGGAKVTGSLPSGASCTSTRGVAK